MAAGLKKSYGVGITRKHNIIDSILGSDFKGIEAALEEDPSCVNAIHEDSGMNAPMLAAHGDMPTAVSMILAHAAYLDFEHRDSDGDDLLLVAMDVPNDRIMREVSDAYEAHAVHLLNNFDENAL